MSEICVEICMSIWLRIENITCRGLREIILYMFPSPKWPHSPTLGWPLNRKSICWTECLQLDGKILLYIKLLGYSLFKDKYPFVFEYVVFINDACDDYACICMLCVCETNLFPLCIFIMHLHTHGKCYEFIIWL